jgi:putative NADH-flavin reductase
VINTTRALMFLSARVVVWACVLMGGMSWVPQVAVARSLKVLIYADSTPLSIALADEALRRGDRVHVVNKSATFTAGPAGVTVTAGDVTNLNDVARTIADEEVVIVPPVSGDAAAVIATAKSTMTAVRVVGTFAPYLIWIGDAATLKDDSGMRMVVQHPPPRDSIAAGQMAALNYFYSVTDDGWTYMTPPPHVTDGPRTGIYRQSGDMWIKDAGAASTISVADLAVAALDEAQTQAHVHLQFTVAY